MFHDIIHPLLRVLSGILGFVFLYMGLFMYQDEAGKLHNRLVSFWLEATTRHEQALSTGATIIRACTLLAERVLTVLFGKELISWKAILVSLGFSMSSVLILGMVKLSLAGKLVASLWVIGLALFVVRPVVTDKDDPKSDSSNWWYVAGILMVLTVAFFVHFQTEGALTSFVSTLVLALRSIACGGIGFLFDLGLLIGGRFLIRVMSRTNNTFVLLGGLAITALWSFILFDSSWFGETLGHTPFGPRDPVSRILHILYFGKQKGSFYFDVLNIGLRANLFDLFVSASVLLVLLVVLLHRVFWEMASRSVLALYQWEVLADRKIQLAVALTFLTIAFPWVEDLLKMFKG